MPPYKYTTQSPNPRTSYLDIHSLPGHTFGLKKRRDITAAKNAMAYQVYCSCKWKDPRWHLNRRGYVLSYNDHILEAREQGSLFNVQSL